MDKNNKAKTIIEELLSYSDIVINGDNVWDIQIHDERLYERVLRRGSVGFGEAYMEGWWDAKNLDEFFEHLLEAKIDQKISRAWKTILQLLPYRIFNHQSKTKSFEVGKVHYDIGNDLYSAMLDKQKVYSCGYWNWPTGEAKNLDEAQEAKLDLICRKLNLKFGQKVLDIGCGWGSFAKYAAEKYGAVVTGITISEEQAKLANKLCEKLPVEVVIADYREIEGKFDHIVSIGMFEHVGYKNYSTFMKIVAHNLKDDGLFLLHTIGTNESTTATDPWIQKYIFPNSMLPSMKQISQSAEGIFVMEDWQNLGVNYDKTLLEWFENFNEAWPYLKDKYGKNFYRMWKYYLLSCAATFRVRNNHVWQIVFSKNGIVDGYRQER